MLMWELIIAFISQPKLFRAMGRLVEIDWIHLNQVTALNTPKMVLKNSMQTGRCGKRQVIEVK